MFRLILALTFFASPALAAQRPATEVAAICDAAAERGAERGEAPIEILRALTRTETGRRMDGALRPWPWTVNMEGEGFWFDNRAEALDFVTRRHAQGARSFDIGCFQINFRWHGEAFASLNEMFDPIINARYAARFLGELKAEGGDWRAAIGRYHSRTPSFANKYADRFEAILARLDPPGDLPRLPAPRESAMASADERGSWPPFFAGGGQTGPGAVHVAAPAHGDPERERGAWRGGVALSALRRGSALLRPARPLIE
ncbi:MAG: lytic transglycosylase domain-containing protein [Paracoccaceae bacterium]